MLLGLCTFGFFSLCIAKSLVYILKVFNYNSHHLFPILKRLFRKYNSHANSNQKKARVAILISKQTSEQMILPGTKRDITQWYRLNSPQRHSDPKCINTKQEIFNIHEENNTWSGWKRKLTNKQLLGTSVPHI